MGVDLGVTKLLIVARIFSALNVLNHHGLECARTRSRTKLLAVVRSILVTPA
jgi:hypothetical protein